MLSKRKGEETLPMESAGKENSGTESSAKPVRDNAVQVTKVKQLFAEWLDDSSGYDEQTWPQLKTALNENHSKSRKLFNE
jgi:hypothetical protein